MPHSIAEIQEAYNNLARGLDERAHAEDDEGNRAYGGAIRSAKGSLVESIAKNLVKIAWDELGGHPDRLSLPKEMTEHALGKAVETLKGLLAEFVERK